MIPHRFRYEAPTSTQDAVALLHAAPAESVVLAGGTWVVPALVEPDRRVAQVVDLRRTGLDSVDERGDRVALGAIVTYTTLLRSDTVRRRLPLLARVAEGVTGGEQLRNQATIGGAACAARPASDIPGALLLLGALAVVEGTVGRRTIPVSELWRGPFRTSLAADEVLVGFDLPAQRGAGAYRKVKLRTSSWPILTAGVVAALGPDGALARLDVAIGGAAALPFALPLDDLLGTASDPDLPHVVAARASEALTEPWADELAPAAYRVTALPGVVRRVVAAALTDARTDQENRHV
jgi:aerobic carbon-monoxide dehydrogenase medium subunit